MPLVLVVEDDKSTRENLCTALEEAEGIQTLGAANAEEAMSRLDLAPVDVVVSDVHLGRMSGVDLLSHIAQQHPETAAILVTAFGTIEQAVEAMRLGAVDYITKPINLDQLELLVRRAHRRQTLERENRALRREVRRKFSISGLIGQSHGMQELLRKAEQIAPTNATVLITGESGTGKELMASAIHGYSRRTDAPLVKVNCVALAETLIESELFGHEKGAFTGAHKTRRGRFEAANNGTLFLDEIGDLSVPTQLKLLRALQEREIERVGGQVAIPVDVRLIAATNRDLERAMADGTFREELYYRLKVVTLHIPPLRDRPGDVPLLLDYFLDLFCREHDKAFPGGFSTAAQEKLRAHPWPGNVRELRNLVESMVVTARGSQIGVANLPSAISQSSEVQGLTVPLGLPMDEVERRYVIRTLEMLEWNKVRASAVLGMSKKTLYRRLHGYGVLDTADPDEG